MVQWDLCRVIYQSNPDKDPRPEEQANDQVQTRFFVESTKPKKRQLSVTNTQNIPLNSWKKILKFVIDFLLFRNKLKLVKESMRGLRRCKQNPGCALKKLLFLQPDSPQKKNSTGNYGSADRKTDFFPRATVLLPTHPPREGGGGRRVAHLPLFSLFHHGGPPSLNHDHVRLLLHHRLCIPRMWLTVPRMWLTIPPGRRAVAPGRRAVAPRGRGRALLAVRGWVGWLKNKIMIWLDIYLLYLFTIGIGHLGPYKVNMLTILFLLLWERSIRIFSAGMGFFLFVISKLAWSMLPKSYFQWLTFLIVYTLHTFSFGFPQMDIHYSTSCWTWIFFVLFNISSPAICFSFMSFRILYSTRVTDKCISDLNACLATSKPGR